MARSAALLLALLAACAPSGEDGRAPAATAPVDQGDEGPPVQAPPGTAFLVDDLPLAAAEIDRQADWIGTVHVEWTRPQLRRLALVDLLLPRLALQAAEPAAHARALAAASVPPGSATGDPVAWREAGAVVAEVRGTFKDLGYVIWGTARELSPGTWSGPVEDVGRVLRLRLEERPAEASPHLEVLRVTVAAFEYLTDPPLDRDRVQRAIDEARLVVVDPGWSDAIPERWKYRMRATVAPAPSPGGGA